MFTSILFIDRKIPEEVLGLLLGHAVGAARRGGLRHVRHADGDGDEVLLEVVEGHPEGAVIRRSLSGRRRVVVSDIQIFAKFMFMGRWR